jgi:hypothetical protein
VKRYPLDALEKVRKAEVDERAQSVAGEVEKTERARRQVLGARDKRERAERAADDLLTDERERVESGTATAADLQALASWQAAEAQRLAALCESERRAAESLVGQKRAEDAARQELALAEAEAKAVTRHKERWSRDRVRERDLAEEEAAEDVDMARRAREGGQ